MEDNALKEIEDLEDHLHYCGFCQFQKESRCIYKQEDVSLDDKSCYIYIQRKAYNG